MTDNAICQNFLQNASFEVTPKGAEKIDDFREFLAPDTRVYVTFLPESDFADTIKTVQKLQAQGMTPVPHFAARSIPSKDFFETNLRDLTTNTSVREALLIGGGVDKPLGEFHESMQILQLGLFEKYGITQLGVAGHPEGSPDITPDLVQKAIDEKNAYAQSSRMQLYIATQFCFEAAPIIAWAESLAAKGNKLPIHIGVPGLATIKTLLKHAQHCGIGPSMKVLAAQAANITKLMITRTPDILVRELAEYQANTPSSPIRSVHMYPLGGLKKTVLW
ncbi:MAG: metFprotein, partial [Pseudomonadota bacterium]